jgi:peptidyl-prolyl cis-trans isomerase C
MVLAACQGEKNAGTSSSGNSSVMPSKDFTRVIAKVGDIEITQGYFDKRYDQLSEAERKVFSGEGWKDRFLDQVIEETVLYKKALDEHLDQDPAVQTQLDIVRRQVLRKAYADQLAANSMPDEQTIKAYYESNKEEFKTLPRVLASHISCKEKSKIDEAYASLKAGHAWDAVADKYTEDPNTKGNHGLIGWINPDGFVMGVGIHTEFNKIAFSLGFQEYSKPVLINGNWEIIRAGQKVEAKIPPLDEVKARVVERLRSVVRRRDYKQAVQKLEREYHVQRFGQYKKVAANTAEELFKRASEIHDAQTKIDYYNQIADKFPESELADESLFTAGFIYSEELHRPNFAFQEFNRLINKYPDSKYVEDAKWMMKNMGKSGLENVGDSSAEEIQKQIKSQKGK